MENNSKYISDELIAAYLEGETTPEETLQVLEAIKTNPVLRETLDIAMRLDDERFAILPALQMAAESGENLCSVLCEAYIMQRRGVEFENNELLTIARKNHWLKAQGTPLHSIGQLLAHKGLMVTRRYDASLDDLIHAFKYDNDIIVALDRDKLYPDLPDEEDAPNHAVVVIDVDKGKDTITLYDPAQLPVCDFQLSIFENAWKESQNYMVRVLQTVEDYEPHPINLDNIVLTDDLLELREAIAENAHDVWAAARIREGWSYDSVRDDQKKQHPDLVPYSSLPDEEKEYDRMMALSTIRMVMKLGFEIGKK